MTTRIDPTKNFAMAQAVTGYDAQALSITLKTGTGDRFPNPSTDGAFNLVWWAYTAFPSPAEDPKVEIIRCVLRVGDTLTIERGQEGTTASTKNDVGHTYMLIHGPTAKTIQDIQAALNLKLETETDPVFTASPAHGITTDLINTWNSKQDALGFTPENTSNKGANNGYSELDAGGKVPLARLPSTLLVYKGVWNASTNTPALTATDTNKKGWVYTVSVAGTQFGIAFKIGDWFIYNDSGVGEKSDNSDDVTSVNGQQGTVVLTTDNINEGATNLYFSNARAVSAMAGLYEVPLTFGSGLTRTANVVANDLIVGKTGGQTIKGGTAIADILKLQGTTGNGTLTSPAIQMIVGNNGGTVAMTVLNNGNIGIGTTSPAEKLEVAGNIKFTNTDSKIYSWNNNGYLEFYNSGTGGIVINSPDAYAFTRFNNAGILIKSTLAPTTTDAISIGGNEAQVITMLRNSTANTAGNNLTLISGGATSGATDKAGGDLNLKSGISTGTGTSALRFFTATAGSTGTADNTPTEKMTILGNGNVGIGVKTPSYPLVIGVDLGPSIASGNAIVVGDPNYGQIIIGSTASSLGKLYWDTTNKNFHFSTKSDDNWYSDTLVLKEGKVGIATTSPTAKLDINSDIVRIRTPKTPATAGATGNQGDICWDADFIYACVATNTWKKASIVTW